MSDNSLKKGRYTRHSNKIGLYSTSHDRIGFLNNNNDVVLSFPFKDTVLEAGMSKEDAGREERFLHQEIDGADIDTLFEPKAFTNFKLIGSDKNIQDTTFFDENGKSTRKAFLKSPLKYSRISSHFSGGRMHPILKIVRPHYGVDYAAPVGTPVHTIGDGVVIKKGYSGGAGQNEPRENLSPAGAGRDGAAHPLRRQ